MERNPPGAAEDTTEMVSSFDMNDMHAMHAGQGPTPEMVKQLEREGKIDKWTLDMWNIEEKDSFWHERGFEVQTTVFTSPPIRMKTGESHFSIPTFTPLPFPKEITLSCITSSSSSTMPNRMCLCLSSTCTIG
jgi:hypothetical protein